MRLTQRCHCDTIVAMRDLDPASMTLRLPPHIRAAISRLARRQGITTSALVRVAIAEHLARWGDLPDPPTDEETDEDD